MSGPIEPSRRGGRSKRDAMREKMGTGQSHNEPQDSSSDSEEMVQVTIRMSKGMRDKLQRHFKANGEYLASGMRRVVFEWFNRQ